MSLNETITNSLSLFEAFSFLIAPPSVSNNNGFMKPKKFLYYLFYNAL